MGRPCQLELWKAYIQLTEAEAAFRIHKSDLSIRPIWHQRQDRVLAHILVCFLAYMCSGKRWRRCVRKRVWAMIDAHEDWVDCNNFINADRTDRAAIEAFILARLNEAGLF